MFLFPAAHNENTWCLAPYKIRPFLFVPKIALAASFRTVMFANFGRSLFLYPSLKIKFTEESKCHRRTPAMNTYNGKPNYVLSVTFH